MAMCSREKGVAAVQQNEILEYQSGDSYRGIFSTTPVIRLLRQKSITELWPIQSAAYKVILGRHDVVVRAKTGSGKTYTYLICMVHQCYDLSIYNKMIASPNLAPNVIIILPRIDSCEQVHAKLMNLIESTWSVKVALWTKTHSLEEVLSQDGRHPDVVVSTPSCVLSYIKGILEIGHLENFLQMLILDEVDVLLSPSYEEDLKSLLECIPKSCQCLLFSGTPSADVDILRNLVKRNPHIVTLTEKGSVETEVIPYNVQQFYISCAEEDKLLYVENLLYKLCKAVIFTSSNDVCCRVTDFLKQCGLNGEVIKADLDASLNEQLFEDLDAGRLCFLIAVDDNQSTVDSSRERKVHERDNECQDLGFGMVKGINPKKVRQVINFNMPQSVSGYFRRIVHAGRPNDIGICYSLVSPSEMGIIQDVKSFLRDDPSEDSKILISESSKYPRRKLYEGFIELYGWDSLSWLGRDCDPIQLMWDRKFI